MNIKIAEEKDFNDVKKITRETIMEIYPKYYPHGAVRFFAEHHSDENIMRDIRAGIVYLLISDEGIPAGTVTLTNNEIDRLFVLPSFQRRGYGKSLMDMAEEKISSISSEGVTKVPLLSYRELRFAVCCLTRQR